MTLLVVLWSARSLFHHHSLVVSDAVFQPTNLPPYPQTLSPVMPPQHAPEPLTSSFPPTGIGELQPQLQETQSSLTGYADKFHLLESLITEHDGPEHNTELIKEFMEERKREVQAREQQHHNEESSAVASQRRPVTQPQRLIGTGSSMRPPGEGGPFDYILNSLQDVPQNSLQISAGLGSLNSALSKVHDSVGSSSVSRIIVSSISSPLTLLSSLPVSLQPPYRPPR